MHGLPPGAYQYAELPIGGHLRTLHLLPGFDDDPLQCTLQTSSISDAHYEAISYVWGSGIRDHQITCGGKGIPITANLYSALRHLRSDTVRILWAHSICIDQDNHNEKGLQVSQLGQIYRSAVRVLIVIGDNDLGVGEAAHSLVNEIGMMVKETLQECGCVPDSFPWPDADAPIGTDMRWRAFNLFLSQDWFRRGWVVQEAALAEEARLILGKTELDWTNFILTCSWQMLRFPVRQDWLDRISLYSALYLYYNPSVLQAFKPGQIKESHLSMLAGTEGLQFTDPRDRIFAMGEVAKDFPGYVSMQPDYELPFLLVYKQFAVDFIRQNQSVELLEYVGHTETSLEDGIPSWVPRWYAIPSQNQIRDHHTVNTWDVPTPSPGYTRVLFPSALTSRDGTFHEPHVDGRCHLHVRGVLVGTVVYASRLRRNMNNGKDIVDLTIDLLKHVQHPNTHTAYPQHVLVDVLLSNLTSGVHSGPWSRFRRDREALALHLLERTGSVDEEELARRRMAAEGGDLRAMVKRISIVKPLMTFVITSRGHMGMVPEIVREGDEFAIVFGMNRLSILRRVDDGEGYRFLGVGTVMGRARYRDADEGGDFLVLGDERYKERVDWDIEEQDFVLC